MDTVDAAPALKLIASRLTTLSALLDKAEAQWNGRNLDELAGSRLAPDMFCLAQQIWAACTQARQFVQWCQGVNQPVSPTEMSTWEEGRAVLADTLAELDGAIAAGLTAPESKRITIAAIGLYLDLTARRYLDDWILPNLYFHVSTAHGILRMKGVEIGKGDYMAHVAGDLRPIEAAEA